MGLKMNLRIIKKNHAADSRNRIDLGVKINGQILEIFTKGSESYVKSLVFRVSVRPPARHRLIPFEIERT